LNFRVSGTHSNKALQLVGEKLANLTQLRDLGLDFSRRACYFNETSEKPITDEGLESLGTSLKKLTQLQTLKLTFKYCKRLSHNGIRKLLMAFETHDQINSLQLDFLYNYDYESVKNGNNGVDSLGSYEELEELTLQLSKLMHISLFSFRFSNSHYSIDIGHACGFGVRMPYTDLLKAGETIERLSQTKIGPITSLEIHPLRLGYTPEPKHKDFEKFFKVLANLSPLGDVGLDFDYLPPEKNDGLYEALVRHSNTTSLYLSFPKNVNFENDLEKVCMVVLMKLSKLSSFYLRLPKHQFVPESEAIWKVLEEFTMIQSSQLIAEGDKMYTKNFKSKLFDLSSVRASYSKH